MTIHDRLAELGIELPSVAAAAGSYLPTVRTGNLLFTAGQLPFVDGKLPATGRVGAEVSPEDAKAYARLAGLNLLAAVHAAVGLDAVERERELAGVVQFGRCAPSTRAVFSLPRLRGVGRGFAHDGLT